MSTSCPSSTWKALVQIKEQREAAKAREQDLIKARDAVRSELAELGVDAKKDRTRAYMKRTADYYEALEGIEACRRIAKHLADQFEKAINAGMQGKLFEIEDDELAIPLPDAPLFDGGEPGDPPVGGQVPAPAPSAAPAAPCLAPTGLDQLVGDCVGINPAAVRDLREVGIITLGDFSKFMQESGGDVSRLPKGVHIADFEVLTAKVQAISGQLAEHAPEAATEKKTKTKKPKAKAAKD